MARSVKLDVSDAIITIDNQVKVHRGLLCNVSNSMRYLVEAAEENSSSDSSTVHLYLLSSENDPRNERGLVLWSGFLYGQSMSAPSSDWPENHDAVNELFALMQVHQLSLDNDHSDAEDASIDAIRDLLNNVHGLYQDEAVAAVLRDSTIALQVLADFVLYGEQGDRYTELIDANLVPVNERDVLFRVSEKREAAMHKDLLRVSNEILKKFFQKAKDERAGVPAPDLIARCRYHTHAAKGQPCYLNK